MFSVLKRLWVLIESISGSTPGPYVAAEVPKRPRIRHVHEEMELLDQDFLAGRVKPGSTIKIPMQWQLVSGVRSIPEQLTVDGFFDLTFCRLRTIGRGLTVTRDLTLSTMRDGLPNELNVQGSLFINNCSTLKFLPFPFNVGRSIHLQSCSALECLPDGLRVQENLRIVGGQKMLALPRRLHVNGDFLLSGTRVESLPDDLEVKGSLTVQGRSRLKNIPANFRVGQDLVLRRCKIETLPRGLKVGRSLRIQGARTLRTLPAVNVPGVLDLQDCTALEELSAGTQAHHLKLQNCSGLKSLPDKLDIRGRVDLRNCTALTALPKGLKVGFGLVGVQRGPVLMLSNCSALTTLPRDLLVNGRIEVAGSGINTIPPDLKAVELIWQGVLVPHECVVSPHTLSAERILTESNAELRRIMLERAGLEHVLNLAGAKELDSDTDAGGVRKLLSVSLSKLGRDTRYLFCQCPSTGRKYLLRVPPGTRSCRKAAAWIAGFESEDDYRPVKET